MLLLLMDMLAWVGQKTLDLFCYETDVNHPFTINLRSALFRTKFARVRQRYMRDRNPDREMTMAFDNNTTADQVRRRSRARTAGDMRLIISVAICAFFASAAAGAMVVTTSI